MNIDLSQLYPGYFRDGEFVRPQTKFRNWVRSNGKTSYVPEKDRYHLYVSLACPWSHRTVILRSLRKLENVISMSVTSPIWNENGWFFGDATGTIPDYVNHKRDIVEIYRMVDPQFSEEETVPILWDKKTKTIVNNESKEIMRMFDVEFRHLGDPSVSLYPESLATTIDSTIDQLYDPICNGVYKTGFARTQRAYDQSATRLFQNLDHWENILSQRRYLCGTILTEADIALFVTLIRFDTVYYSHFKCNIQRIQDYTHLFGWLCDVYQTPGIAETCDFFHIKNHYYGCHKDLNPLGIIPIGPKLSLDTVHGRDKKFR